MTVVIIGAGIGGLVTALRLHHLGVSCAVYEKAGSVRELGVGINLLPNAVAGLAGIGLLSQLSEAGLLIEDLRYAHRLGPQILARPCGMAAGFATPQISIHRGRLQGVLAQAVRERMGPDALQTGHTLTGFDQDDQGVTAHFTAPDGSPLDPVRGSVLVAADGIHSAVRSALFPAEGPPRWNGVTMWRGCTDWPVFAGGASQLIAGGNAAKLVVYPIAAGRLAGTRLTNWAVCVLTGQPGDPPPHRQDWSRRVSAADIDGHLQRFATPLVDHVALARATGECFEFPMCDRDPLPSWSQGRVSLLGDAAHPMYPMGSNGAGQAVMDAVSLSTCLASHASPEQALRAYQDERLPVTSDVVLRNRAGGPERVIDEVERRAPEGFSDLADVIDRAELEQIVASYAQASGQSVRS